MKDLRVTKIFKETMFKDVWDKFEALNSFQRESFAKCLRLILVFKLNGALRKSLFSVFIGFSLVLTKASFWQQK